MELKEINMNKKTVEFIEKARKVHGEKYDYSQVEYVNNYTKVKIFCERHGLFEQSPNKHLSGSNCRTCAHTITTEEFIRRASEVHSNKYDYSNTVYNFASEKVEINCGTHGKFYQKAQSHLFGSVCPKCANESRSNKLSFTTEEFIEKAKKVHGDKYDYSLVDYKGSRDKVKIICSLHGEFLQSPNCHLNGKACNKCGKMDMADKATKTTEDFIKEAVKIHGVKYSYFKTHYLKSNEKIIITCKEHGDFEQNPNNHLKGQGCPKCCNENNIGGFGRTDYIKRAKGRICTFYTLRCFDENEQFYKIGITMVTVKERYKSVRSMPYSYEIISEIYGEAGFIWDLELSEKTKLKTLRYSPKLEFKGSKTECFTNYKLENA